MLLESKTGPNHESLECHAKMFTLCPDGNKESLKVLNYRIDKIRCIYWKDGSGSGEENGLRGCGWRL